MAAGRYNFIIEQGTTTQFEVQYLDANDIPIDLTGYTARMQIRQTIDSSIVVASLDSTLLGDGTGLNLSGSNNDKPLASGSIGIYISAATSSLFTFDDAVYDLELISNNTEVTRLLMGTITLSQAVTR